MAVWVLQLPQSAAADGLGCAFAVPPTPECSQDGLHGDAACRASQGL